MKYDLSRIPKTQLAKAQNPVERSNPGKARLRLRL
jgi:hypothetical protein